MKAPYDLIKNVLITEKCTDLKEKNKYAFKVHPDANKIEIRNAIEQLFDVTVKSVNIMNYRGKVKRAGKMMKPGRRANWKKAIVTLEKGVIDFM